MKTMRLWGVAVLLCAPASPQTAAREPQAQQRPPEYKVRVALASFDVEVLDREGEPVLGLRRGNFEVREDGRVQEITHFAWLSDRPVSAAFVLDTSTLKTEQLSRAKEILLRLAHLLAPTDEVALLSFDARDAYVEHDFTRERRRLVDALENIGVPSRRRSAGLKRLLGATPRAGLAVDFALERLERARNEKKAALLVSDTFGGLGPGTTDHVERSGATLLTLSFGSKSAAVVSLGADAISKRQLTRGSGGRDFDARSEDTGATCRAIAFCLKNHYSVGYQVRLEKSRDDAPEVEITVPGKPYKVLARRRYLR